MMWLMASNAVLAVCLIVNIIASAKERRYLTGLLASRDYLEYKSAEDGTPARKHTNAFKKREEREKRFQEGEKV